MTELLPGMAASTQPPWLADGCTLGLFISGQLAISGIYFGVVIFAVAMLTARLIFGKVVEQEKIQ